MYLSDNAYSSKFGTFLGDNEEERFKMRLRDETVSLWSYTNRPEVLLDFLNCMYEPNVGIIWPSVAPISIVSIIEYILSILVVKYNFLREKVCKCHPNYE